MYISRTFGRLLPRQPLLHHIRGGLRAQAQIHTDRILTLLPFGLLTTIYSNETYKIARCVDFN